MFYRLNPFLCLFLFLILAIISCGTGTENASANDRNDGSPAPDSMPVVHPGQFDSSGTIQTAPSNDDMNAYPDTPDKP